MSQPTREAGLAEAYEKYKKELKGVKDPMPFDEWLSEVNN